MKNVLIKSLCAVFCTALLFMSVFYGVQAKEAPSSKPFYLLSDYEEYLESHSQTHPVSDNEITLTNSDIIKKSDDVTATEKNGAECTVLMQTGSTVSYGVTLDKASMYAVYITYINLPLKEIDIEFSLSVNGNLPFKSASNLILPREYQNESEIITDSRGNDLRSRKKEISKYRTLILRDKEYAYRGLYFAFEEGQNEISISALRAGFGIQSLTLKQVEDYDTYSQYIYDTEKYPREIPKDKEKNLIVKQQGENVSAVSHTVLYPTYDKMDAITEVSNGDENSPSKLKLNTIGQNTFKTAGQYIEWKITAPYSGYYNIGLRSRQNIIRGFYSSRNIYIDGKTPFAELNNVRFSYTYNWDIKLLGDDNPYKIYLTQGEHSVRLEVSSGDAGKIVNEFENIIFDLNTIYRQVLTITGSEPDTNRDYNLYSEIPDFNKRLTELSQRIDTASDRLKENGIMRGNNAVAAQTMSIQLKSFVEKPRSVAMRLHQMQENISSLSAWVLSMRDQPLEIDYLFIKSPQTEIPQKNSGFLKQFMFRVKSFTASFFEDYTTFDESDNPQSEAVSVWVGAGRDQAQIVKDLTDDRFETETGIDVMLSLVQQGIIEAVAAGKGPDIMLFSDIYTPVNLAARTVLEDLSKYKGYDQIAQRFNAQSLEPYIYSDGVYAFPIEETFPMMFYRTDIFEELGLTPPKTWEEFYHAAGKIQKKKLMVGVPSGTAIAPDDTMFKILLFQNGGRFYNDDLSATDLNSESSLKAFKQWTDFYTKYGFKLEFSFYERFRSGEMPLGIQPYVMYNQLTVAAPEIRGLWKMAPLPGTVLQDGSINSKGVSASSSAIMLAKTKNKEGAFKFLEWFTRAETQTEYGLTVENVLGQGGRYCPANKESLSQMNWTENEYTQLKAQSEENLSFPVIPATYMINRNITNAFRAVVIKQKNPRETLYTYSKDMDVEIEKKRKELG